MAKKPSYEELEQRVKEFEEESFERKQAEEELKHQKEHLESLIEYSSLAIVTLDEGHNIITCNRDFERLFHFKESEIVERNLDEIIAGQEYIKDATSYTKETLKGKAIHGSGKRKRKDGTYIDVEFTGVPVIIDGKVIGAYGIYQDISERKRVEEETERHVAQVELIYEVAHRVTSELELKALFSEIVTAVCDAFDYYGVMLLLVDEETERLNMQSISGGYTDIFPKDLWLAKGEGMIGYAAATGETQLSDDVIKHPHFVRKAEEETKSELAVPIKSGQEVIGVLDLQSSQFNAFDKIDVVVMETLADQIAVAIRNAQLYETVQQELTERKRLEDELERLIITDKLTGLYNKRHFDKELDREIRKVVRSERPLSLIMMDIDEFKKHNDRYGHTAGDEVLEYFGKKVIPISIRDVDSGFRYGGEEFAVILPGTTGKNAVCVADRIREYFRKHNFTPISGENVNVTVSLGIAEYLLGESPKDFTKRADLALYSAKDDGRDRIKFFE